MGVVAQACSSIYFTMEALHQVHFLYQYSLKMFLDIFSTVLVCPGLSGVSDYTARLKTITEELFTVTYYFIFCIQLTCIQLASLHFDYQKKIL